MTPPPITKQKIGAWRTTSPTKILTKVIVILLLIITIAVAAIPGYLQGGKWTWSEIPPLTNTHQMRNLLTTGIEINNWQTIKHKEIRIGGTKWSAQAIIQNQESPTIVLLAPQTYYTNKPYVEWTDIQGLEKWKTDSQRILEFTVNNNLGTSSVKARFFRAWNQQTFAIVQWYAFPNGGSFSSANWFWRDQIAQLKQQRIPWIAVCLKIPLNPLDELDEVEALAISLAQQVQGNLQESTFNAFVQPNN
jgi:cyanoexosortase B-associated protein